MTYRRRSSRIILEGAGSVLAAALLAGCSALSPPELEAPMSLHLQLLLDVSGSYEVLPQAVATATSLVDILEGGDRVVIRNIATVSHRGSSVLLDKVLPTLPRRPASLEAKALVQFRQDSISVEAVRDSIKGVLASVVGMRPSLFTDIVGSFAAAAEDIAFDQERRSVILVFTDGEDNGPHRNSRLPVDLTRTSVGFLHFDPAGTLEKRERLRALWHERVAGHWGAEQLLFVPHGAPLDLERFRSVPSSDDLSSTSES